MREGLVSPTWRGVGFRSALELVGKEKKRKEKKERKKSKDSKNNNIILGSTDIDLSLIHI